MSSSSFTELPPTKILAREPQPNFSHNLPLLIHIFQFLPLSFSHPTLSLLSKPSSLYFHHIIANGSFFEQRDEWMNQLHFQRDSRENAEHHNVTNPKIYDEQQFLNENAHQNEIAFQNKKMTALPPSLVQRRGYPSSYHDLYYFQKRAKDLSGETHSMMWDTLSAHAAKISMKFAVFLREWLNECGLSIGIISYWNFSLLMHDADWFCSYERTSWSHPLWKWDHNLTYKLVSHDSRFYENATHSIKKDRSIAFRALLRDFRPCAHLPSCLVEDRDFMKQAVRIRGQVLRFASDKFRQDKELLSIAVQKDYGVIECISFKLRDDRDFVLPLVRIHGGVLVGVSERLRADRELVLEALSNYGYAIQYVSEDLRLDREVCLTALRNNGESLQYVHPDFKKDPEMVLEAVRHSSGSAFMYAHTSLFSDRDMILRVVKVDGRALQPAAKNFEDDREVILEALKTNGKALRFLSDELRNDTEVVLEACRRDSTCLHFASQRLQRSRKFLMEIQKMNAERDDESRKDNSSRKPKTPRIGLQQTLFLPVVDQG